MKQKRTFAVVLAVLCVFTLLFSLSFLAVEQNHECTGEDCPVCQMMAEAHGLLRGMGGSRAFSAFGILLILLAFFIGARSQDSVIFDTLISLKVKLSI